MTLLKKFMSGQIALWCAFWLIGVPLAFLWDVSGACTIVGCGIQDPAIGGLLLALFAVLSIAIPFVSFAIWRSSSNYPQKTPWRTTVALLGTVGIAAAGAIFLLLPRLAGRSPAARQRSADARVFGTGEGRGFPILLAMGTIDNSTRTALLTFLPFLLQAKGADLPTIGFALTLAFLGGAAGKLVCTFIGMRIGVFATVILTESLTTLGILALLPLPLAAVLPMIPLLGVALSGTSSVLYGSVARLVAPSARTRAFAVFYTGTIGGGALAPFAYGFVSDAIGVAATLAVIAGVAALTLPLAVFLRGPELVTIIKWSSPNL